MIEIRSQIDDSAVELGPKRNQRHDADGARRHESDVDRHAHQQQQTRQERAKTIATVNPEAVRDVVGVDAIKHGVGRPHLGPCCAANVLGSQRFREPVQWCAQLVATILFHRFLVLVSNVRCTKKQTHLAIANERVQRNEKCHGELKHIEHIVHTIVPIHRQ